MRRRRAVSSVTCLFILSTLATATRTMAQVPVVTCSSLPDDHFATDQLVAWCIVPFDARQRTPAERVQMLKRLGLRRVAYDWRDAHVPSFEEEILQYQRHGIEFFAFWGWHDSIEPLIEAHGIRPQFWMTNPSPVADTQDERVQLAARQLAPYAEKALSLGCQFGVYNHGGWGGETENLIAVCTALRAQLDTDAIGVVYNFHHGHAHIEGFEERFATLKPYLLCVNINGMVDIADLDEGVNKILPIGCGKHEVPMLRAVQTSRYTGPIGIIDHRPDVDAEESLRANLEGLSRIRKQLGEASP